MKREKKHAKNKNTSDEGDYLLQWRRAEESGAESIL